MWSTSQVVSKLREYMGEVSTEKILENLNRAYLKLTSTDTEDFLFFNVSDQTQPFAIINPTKGISKYAINETNLVDTDDNPISLEVEGQTVFCRKVARAFTQNLKGKGYGYYSYKRYSPYGYPAYYENWFTRHAFYEVPIHTSPRRNDNDASILFFEDYEGPVFVEFYYIPSPLETVNTPMLIDVDEWVEELVNGSVGYYEDVANGKSERKKKFLEEDVYRFMNEATDSQDARTPISYTTRKVG